MSIKFITIDREDVQTDLRGEFRELRICPYDLDQFFDIIDIGLSGAGSNTQHTTTGDRTLRISCICDVWHDKTEFVFESGEIKVFECRDSSYLIRLQILFTDL